MSAATRTDIHRPSAVEFDPQAYTLIGTYYFGSERTAAIRGAGTWHDYDKDVAALAARGHHQGGSQAGGCGHCGAMLAYAAIMLREDAHEWILVGEQCLDNRFSGTKAEFATLRATIAAARKSRKLDEVFEALCEQHPQLAYATYAYNIGNAGAELEQIQDEYSGDEYQVVKTGTSWAQRTQQSWAIDTMGDIAHRARQYGGASEKQCALLTKLLTQLDEADARLKVREVAAVATPRVATPRVVGGRQVITGEIISSQWKESDYGSTLKITIKADNGQRFYGTCPAALDYEVKGRRVTLTATVKLNENDHTHGYYSRPTKASFVD